MEGTSTVPDASAPPVSPVSPVSPVPPVPPTPPVLLSALLAREDLGLVRIAGPSDADTAIHWAHTSEMADPYPYLLGGELLLTAGVHIPEAAGSGTYFDDYVARIVAAGGAALGFGVAPVHDTVPRALVAACDTYGLPLIEVPPRTTFSGVARAVWQLMAQARHTELRRVTEAQQSLAAAAARPDPVATVLRQLAQRVGGWAVLYGPEGAELARAGRVTVPTGAAGQAPGGRASGGQGATARAPGEQAPAAKPSAGQTPTAQAPGGQTSAEQALAELARVVRPGGTQGGATPSSATNTVGGTHLAAYALGSGQGFVLGIGAARREPGDHTIASVAAVLLSLLTGEHQSGSGAARSAALVRLLLGASPEAVAPLLGGGERWVVVHARPAGDGPAPDTVAASALGAALGSALVDVGGEVVRVLVPGDREPAPQAGWTCGVSAPAGPHEWAAADTQAARALARARAIRTALVRHGERPALADLVPASDAEAHARALLAPIAATPALTETLRTWLSLHGSWDRTAVALSVHRNTVRQRIARCSALLGADLDDPDVRMELWFVLREG
ncbi:PucR family transcriptional regulator ligand-binding domain-containing protein [Streptomyces sp. NPDC058470]|uniref:PucR family transcriptional regulator n=1 Tax=Streptomyces sp. NPDC058470 TaxID=3346515 RepID=UPI003653DA28